MVRALALVVLAGCLSTPSRPLDGPSDASHTIDGMAPGTAPDAPAFTGGFLLGDTTDWGANDNHLAGSAEASSFVARADGTIEHLGFFYTTDQGTATVQIGVYGNAATPDGDPDTLLGKATISAPHEAWNDVALATGIPVTGGRVYWIAVVSPATVPGNVGMDVRYAFTPNIANPAGDGTCTIAFGTCTEHSSESDLTGLPAAWSPGQRFNPSINSFYARDQ